MRKYPLTLVLMLAFSLQLFYAVKLSAQTTTDDPSSQLKAFAGKYQSIDDKSMLLQIMLKDGQLVLKQLWDNQESPFKQTSALEFYNDDRKFPLKFTKSSTGEITQVLAFDRDLWNKVADNYVYKPEIKKTIQLSAEQLKTFEGKYELKGGDGDEFLQITAANDHLVLKQLWDQREISFWPVSDVDFLNEDQKFPLKFTKGADGIATQVLAFNKDVWIKTK